MCKMGENLKVSFDEINEIINKLKISFSECSGLDINKLFKLGEKHDETKLIIFEFLADIMPLLVDDKEEIIRAIIDGISNSVSNFEPLTPPTYANECLNVFENVWNILDPNEKLDFVLKSQYVEVITLKFCQCVNIFFIPQKSLLLTLQQAQCFKTVWNKLCNILILVSDADCGPANDIITCSIKKICNLLEICVNGRFTLNGWNLDTYASPVLVCLEVLLGNSPIAQHHFINNNGLYVILKWIKLLIKEQCYASKKMLDLIGKTVCLAVRENKHCVEYAINENAMQILIKFLKKFKQKVILGIVPALFFLTTDSKVGLKLFYKADGLSVINSLDNSNNSSEALTVLRHFVEGQSDYSAPAAQSIVKSNNSDSSLSECSKKSSWDSDNADYDGNSLKLKTKNLLMNTSDTYHQLCSVKVNNAAPDNNLSNEDIYSSDGGFYTSEEEVLSSSSTE